jgi:hypothetical protein
MLSGKLKSPRQRLKKLGPGHLYSDWVIPETVGS